METDRNLVASARLFRGIVLLTNRRMNYRVNYLKYIVISCSKDDVRDEDSAVTTVIQSSKSGVRSI